MSEPLPPLPHPEDWRLALAEARFGDLSDLVEIIRNFALSASHREDLATLIEGDLQVRSRKGRPRKISPWALEHVGPVYRALVHGGPGRRGTMTREAALSELALMHGVSEETIRDALEGKHTYGDAKGEKAPAISPHKRKR